jgi:hypothetical protein
MSKSLQALRVVYSKIAFIGQPCAWLTVLARMSGARMASRSPLQ